MNIKEQTRKLAAGCSKHRFEVVDRTDEVSNTYTARGRLRGLKRCSKSIIQRQIDYDTILRRIHQVSAISGDFLAQ